MGGLFLKDLLNLKRLLKQYVLIFLVMLVWAYLMKNTSFVCMYAILCSSMIMLTAFAYDENSDFNKYALTMPLTRRSLVLEKYLLLIILQTAGAAVGLVLSSLLNLVIQTGDNPMETIAFVCGMVFAFFFVYCIVIPIIYKLGIEKARMTLIGVYLLFFIAIYGAISLIKGGSIYEFIGNHFALLAACAIVLVFVAGVVSYFVSVKIVEEKDW